MVILRSFFDKVVRSFLNKIFKKAPTELIAPKRLVIFSLPYTGLHSIQIRKQIIKLFSPAYPHIQLRCIFRPVQRLSSFFRFKDRIPLGLRSHVSSHVPVERRKIHAAISCRVDVAWGPRKRKRGETLTLVHAVVFRHVDVAR